MRFVVKARARMTGEVLTRRFSRNSRPRPASHLAPSGGDQVSVAGSATVAGAGGFDFRARVRLRGLAFYLSEYQLS